MHLMVITGVHGRRHYHYYTCDWHGAFSNTSSIPSVSSIPPALLGHSSDEVVDSSASYQPLLNSKATMNMICILQFTSLPLVAWVHQWLPLTAAWNWHQWSRWSREKQTCWTISIAHWGIRSYLTTLIRMSNPDTCVVTAKQNLCIMCKPMLWKIELTFHLFHRDQCIWCPAKSRCLNSV